MANVNGIHLNLKANGADAPFMPRDIKDNSTEVARDVASEKDFAEPLIQRLDGLSLVSGTLIKATNTIQIDVVKSLMTVMAIAGDVKRVLLMLGESSKKLLAKVAANG